MTLNDLQSGQSGKITGVTGNGSIRRRLLDLGIHSGGIIKVIKAAPLKDPLEVSLGNGHITLRRTEAILIDIEPL
ncbi:MAG: ferrous iron transport protein A [Candidatus Zixiibacteriota bacterium]